MSDSKDKKTIMKPRDANPEEKAVDNDMSIRLHTSAESIRRDSKRSDMSMNRKDGSAEDNTIFNDKIGFDPYNPANTTRRNKGMTDETSDKRDESIEDNMLSDSQNHENELGDSESGTLCVSDDPRRGARTLKEKRQNLDPQTHLQRKK